MMLHLSSVPLMINKLWNIGLYENYMGDVFLECLLLVNYVTPYLWLLVVRDAPLDFKGGGSRKFL